MPANATKIRILKFQPSESCGRQITNKIYVGPPTRRAVIDGATGMMYLLYWGCSWLIPLGAHGNAPLGACGRHDCCNFILE